MNPVQVVIGDKPAQVLFAGLASEPAGVYRVELIVPVGVPTGLAVPLTVSVAGQAGPPVVIAIQ